MSALPLGVVPSLIAPEMSSLTRPRGTQAPLAFVLAAALGSLMPVAASCAALGVAGCAPRQAAPQIANGERPVTGDARYDGFFTELSELVAAVQEAKREHVDVRSALARRAGLQEDAASDALGARLRERTARLALEGLTLELEFTGIDPEAEDAGAEPATSTRPGAAPARQAAETAAPASASLPAAALPSATLRTPGREPERRELRFLEVLAQAALSAATIYADMGRVAARTDHLLKTAGELRAGVSGTFSEQSKREAVLAKLGEAEEFLPKLSDDARVVSNAADILIAMLDEAANTTQTSQRRRAPREPNPAREVPPREAPARESAASDAAARRAKATERDPAAASGQTQGDFEP